MNKIVLNTILLLITISCTFPLHAQEYTILVPSKILDYQSSSPGCHPIELIEVAAEFIKLHASIACVQKINPELDKNIRVAMRKIKIETPYILLVDYNNCEFISLYPDEGQDLLTSPKWTIYRIKLYPDITLQADFPSIRTTASDSKEIWRKDIPGALLLATHKDEKGQWGAIGPYESAGGFATEQAAIESLLYTNADLTLVNDKGKYKIYTLNLKAEHDARDVREILKKLGAENIPD